MRFPLRSLQRVDPLNKRAFFLGLLTNQSFLLRAVAHEAFERFAFVLTTDREQTSGQHIHDGTKTAPESSGPFLCLFPSACCLPVVQKGAFLAMVRHQNPQLLGERLHFLCHLRAVFDQNFPGAAFHAPVNRCTGLAHTLKRCRIPAGIPFSISGRAGWYGKKGKQNAPLGTTSGGGDTAVESRSA